MLTYFICGATLHSATKKSFSTKLYVYIMQIRETSYVERFDFQNCTLRIDAMEIWHKGQAALPVLVLRHVVARPYLQSKIAPEGHE